MVTYTCKYCGNIAEAEKDAKFCQRCGARLEEQVVTAGPPIVDPAPQANVTRTSSTSKMVMGPTIKEHLMAQLLEGGQKMNGRFEVRRDGVIFVTSSRYGNRVIQVHREDIAMVGLGAKSNILAIHSKDGREVYVKMGGAHKWVSIIQQLKD